MPTVISKTIKRRSQTVVFFNTTDRRADARRAANAAFTQPVAEHAQAEPHIQRHSTFARTQRKPVPAQFRRADGGDVRKLLRLMFPESIGKDRPLKVGARSELLAFCEELKATPKQVRAALRHYVNSVRYHKAVIAPSSVRVALDGTPHSDVTNTERAYSAERLALIESAHRNK